MRYVLLLVLLGGCRGQGSRGAPDAGEVDATPRPRPERLEVVHPDDPAFCLKVCDQADACRQRPGLSIDECEELCADETMRPLFACMGLADTCEVQRRCFDTHR